MNLDEQYQYWVQETNQTDPVFVVSREWIHAHASVDGGWTRRQLQQLGVEWPPVRGWVDRVAGHRISHQAKTIFESYGHRPRSQRLEFSL